MKTLLILMMVFVIYSCSDNPVNTDQRNYEIPSGVGSYWKYAIYDTVSRHRDTVSINIVSSIPFSDGKITRWVYRNLFTADTAFVTFSGETIALTLHAYAQNYMLTLLSPIKLGEMYDTNYGSMHVTSYETVTGDKFTFQKCYKIRREIESLEETEDLKLWIKPGVGIVKLQRSYNSFTGLPNHEIHWTLIDYNIID